MSARSDRPGSVAVVIPTRDRADLIDDAIATAVAQGRAVGEIIVVDDGPDDDTAALVDERARCDHRIRLLRNHRSLGVAATRNRGLAAARTPWVAFLDDDDRWHPRKLDQQLAALAAQPEAQWSATGSITVDRDSDFRRTRLLAPIDNHTLVRRLLAGNPIPGGGSGVLAATELVRGLGGFDERLSIIADWDLWLRLALSAPLAAVREPLTTYVLHARNMSNDPQAALSELELVEEKYLPVRLAMGVGLEERRLPLWVAHHHVRQGRWREACRVYLREARRQRRPDLVARAAVTALTVPVATVRRAR